jgi:hypothetical protein
VARPGTWPKGVSGNPLGRPPRDFTMAGILRELLEVDLGDRPCKVLILERVVQLAMDGVEWPVKMEMAYTDGPPTVHIAQLNGTLAEPPDYSQLSDDELRQAAALARKAGRTLTAEGSNGNGHLHS